MHALRLWRRHLKPLVSAETRYEASDAVQLSRPTSSAYSSLLAVTSPSERLPNALASDIVQPENSVQLGRKTLRAKCVTLDDASSDGKRLRTQGLAAL